MATKKMVNTKIRIHFLIDFFLGVAVVTSEFGYTGDCNNREFYARTQRLQICS